jgi:hypothetical protein
MKWVFGGLVAYLNFSGATPAARLGDRGRILSDLAQQGHALRRLPGTNYPEWMGVRATLGGRHDLQEEDSVDPGGPKETDRVAGCRSALLVIPACLRQESHLVMWIFQELAS